LTVHPEVQRDFKPGHADMIAAHFDPDAFGELYVIADGNHYSIWDGQHRAAAARKALGEEQMVYCRVYRDISLARLAAISLKLNTQRAWRPIDRYRQRVTAGEWKARTIHGILHQFGLKINDAPEDGSVAAVTACDWIIDKAGGPQVLQRVVTILNNAWGRSRDAYHNGIMRGLALVCNKYDGKLDDKALAERLSKTGGPARFIGRARDRAGTSGQNVPYGAAEIIVLEYNKGRGKHRLPSWTA